MGKLSVNRIARVGILFGILISPFSPHAMSQQSVSRSSLQQALRKAARSQEEEAAREALYRYLFISQDWKRYADVFFISTGRQGSDPDPTLLRRFKDHTPPVKPASQSREPSREERKKIRKANRPRSWVLDKATGKEGVFFWASNPKWKGNSEIHLNGGYSYNGLMGLSATFRLVRIKEKWAVKGTVGQVWLN